jgi:hypothetical protein
MIVQTQTRRSGEVDGVVAEATPPPPPSRTSTHIVYVAYGYSDISLSFTGMGLGLVGLAEDSLVLVDPSRDGR